MSLDPPPLQQSILEKNGDINFLWSLFFNQSYQGDAGISWTPNIISLSSSGGSPAIVGWVYKISQYLAYFRVNVIPADGGNTSSVAGTTYIDNFPYVLTGDGVCANLSGHLGGSLGACEKATGKIWIPAWTTVGNPVTVVGIVEAS